MEPCDLWNAYRISVRDGEDVIEAIVAPFRGRSGCSLLDYRADADHNRLVVSLAGEPEPICDALIDAALTARKTST